MISRRNYFAIITLMFILLFLFMGANNLKDQWNDYAVNTYTETAENYPSKINMYVPGNSETEEKEETAPAGEEEENNFSRNMVILIGDGEGTYGKTVREWVKYSRRNIAEYASLKSYRETAGRMRWPEMLVIDPDCVDWKQQDEISFLMQCVQEGTHLIFGSLPDVSVIRDNRQIQDLLGIREIAAEETAAAGLHLYGGFLLGGERVYLQQDEESEADIVFPGAVDASGSPVFPWFLLTSGTKVYMKGIPQEETVETEDYPALIWRKSFGTAYVFAVNGGYMEGIESLGLLAAMSAEMYPYEIYPVVNAQSMVLTGYPSLADENREEMNRIYGRSLKDVFQEVVWTNVWTVFNQYRYKATCMLTPQMDYSDEVIPDGGQVEYYLKIFNEAFAEVGLSGMSISNTPVEQKLEADRRFIEDTLGEYLFSSFYAGTLSEEEVETALQTDFLSSVMTVVRDYKEGDCGILDFLSEYVTSQTSFAVGFDYTYKSDFMVRCLETAAGYLNISYDMKRAAYPESEEDAWEKLSTALGTAVDTFGRMFGEFDRTTVSESDLRIRCFLTLDFKDSRRGDTIQLQVSGMSGTKWFILRTHNETIERIEGGSWRRLEEGAYLIAAEEEKVVITLEPADKRYYW